MHKAKETDIYQAILKTAKSYFIQYLEEEFYLYAQEGQYLIQLWVAHMLLEFGNPSQKLAAKLLAIIKSYSSDYSASGYTLNPAVAQQETEWLHNYLK